MGIEGNNVKMEYVQFDGTTKKRVLLGLINVASMSGILWFCIYYAEEFTIDIFRRIFNGSYYVTAAKYGSFMVIAIPGFLALLIFSVLLLINRLPKKLGDRLFIIFTIFGLAGFASMFVMWPVQLYLLSKYNFSYCDNYTDRSVKSPPVYVSNPNLCLPIPPGTASDIREWLDEQEKLGVELTPMDVQNKITQLRRLSS